MNHLASQTERRLYKGQAVDLLPLLPLLFLPSWKKLISLPPFFALPYTKKTCLVHKIALVPSTAKMMQGGRRLARPGRHEPQYDYGTDRDSGSDSEPTNNLSFNLSIRSGRPPPGHRGLASLSSRGRPRGGSFGFGRAHGRRPPPGRRSGQEGVPPGHGVPGRGQNLMSGPTDNQGYLIDPVDGDRIGSLALDLAFGPNRGPPRPPFERSEPTIRGNAVNASRAGQVAI